MRGRFRGFIIVLYRYDTEETAAIFDTIDDFREYLGYKNNNSARAAISHYIKGDIKYLTDEKARRYTLAKIKDLDMEAAE